MKSSEVKLPVICFMAWLTALPLCYVYFLPEPLNEEDYFRMRKIIGISEYCYSYIIPYLITVVSTLLMFMAYSKDKFRKQGSREGGGRAYVIVRGNRSGNSDEKVAKRKAQQHRQFVKIVSLIVLGYSISCLPEMIVTLLMFYVPVNTEGFMTLILLEECVAMPLLLSNALVNVFVYIMMDMEFRKFVKELLLKLFCFKSIVCGNGDQIAEI